MGGVVNVITKSGTNQLRGSGFGYFQPEALAGDWRQLETVNGAVNTRGFSRHDVGAEGGFPIIRDRFFAFAAINPAWETRELIAAEGFPLRALGEVDREGRTVS
ncbi:MAG TPA: hypothetical protein VNI78_12710 [Vicinamibacterales bacterium]|nr:hypothetical protein [Vicinamibacterales bacterium]